MDFQRNRVVSIVYFPSNTSFSFSDKAETENGFWIKPLRYVPYDFLKPAVKVIGVVCPDYAQMPSVSNNSPPLEAPILSQSRSLNNLKTAIHSA